MDPERPDSELPAFRTVVSPDGTFTPESPAARVTGEETPGPTFASGPLSGRTMTRDVELPRVAAGPLTPDTARGQRIALAIVLVLTFLIAAWIASGLWVGIALGTVMAFTAQPAFRALARRLGDHRYLAAGIVTVVTGLLFTGLGVLFVYIAVDQLVTIGGLFQHKLSAPSLAAMVGEPAAKLIDRLGVSRATVLTKIHDGLSAAATYAASGAAILAQAATGALLGLMMALLTMYYVLLEWRTLIVRLERVLPLNPRHTRALVLEFRQVGRGVLVGTVATAVVQGAMGGLAYTVLDVPQALTWAIATGFGSFLPVVGTGIVWGPIGGYLLLTGRPLAGVCLLVWGVLVVMMATDYIIRPRLVGRSVGHPLLVMFALLGGIQVFGLAGLIVAPILMSLFLAVLRIYEREVRLVSGPVHEDTLSER